MNEQIYPLEFLYDGQCPICLFDVAHLRRRNSHGRLRFIDVSAADFDAREYGRGRDDLLARIHARRVDGVIVEGPEVFRLALAANGLGWLVAPTRWPPFSIFAEYAYRWFARNRGGLSRRYGGIFRRLTPLCDEETCRLPERRA